MKSKKILINEVSDQDIIKSLYLSQGFIVIISVILYVIFFHNTHILHGLFTTSSLMIFYGIGFGLLVVIVDLFLMEVFSESLYDDGGINERVFRALSIKHTFVAMLVVAVSEEFLFRGVLQTKFGLFVSSVCFALIHVRYLKKPLLLISVITLSFFLGYLFLVTRSLIPTIVAHYIIDLTLGLIMKWKLFKRSDRGYFS